MRSAASRSRLIGAVGLAAIVYFALAFTAGFLLGPVRVLLIAPRWGELLAVLLEAPVMLAVSWLACGATVQVFRVRGRGAALAMGVVAFALLMVAEFSLSRLLFGQSTAEFLRAYGTAPGAVGLASQVVFGLIPLLRAGGRFRAA